MNAKIAYLIPCYTDPAQLQRLITALDQEAVFFVHVDAKVSDAPFRALHLPSTASFVSRRTRVYWGGFSIVEATLILLQESLRVGNYERIVLLSGLDYPIKPTAQIITELTKDPKREYIRFFNISSMSAEEYLDKVVGWSFYDAPRWLVNRYYDGRKMLTQRMRPLKRRLLRPYTHCFGQMLWAITNECARYIIKFVEDNPRFTRFYRYCFAPDEHFFHTIVANSPFCLAAGGIEPYVEYGTARMANLHHIHPSINKTYTEDDFNELASSNRLFTKKITSAQSFKLIDLIDSRLR